MSAYVVTDDTINVIVNHYRHQAAAPHNRRGWMYSSHDLLLRKGISEVQSDPELWEMLGNRLRALNEEAVNGRYGEGQAEVFTNGEPYEYRRTIPPRLPVFYGCLQSFLYQCAEEPVYKGALYNELSKELDRAAHELVRYLAPLAKIDIPWG